jgi:hypothetical protein
MPPSNALAQSEKRQNGDDDDDQANDVNNAVHLSFLYVGLKTGSAIQGSSTAHQYAHYPWLAPGSVCQRTEPSAWPADNLPD